MLLIPGDYQYIALTKGHPIQRQWHKNRLNLINFLNFLTPNDKILDAGCGSGNVLLKFAPNVRLAMGIDNNNACISFLRKKIKKSHLQNTSVYCMNLLNIKMPSQSFHKIIMTEILEHFSEDDVRQVLGQIKKILAQEGKILITTPNYKSPWMIIEVLLDKFKSFPKLWGEQHLVKFTPNKLAQILQQSGFKVEKAGTLNAISPFIALINQDLADKISYWEFEYWPFGSLIYLIATKI